MIKPTDSDTSNSVLIVDNNIYETEKLNEWFRLNGFQVEVVTSSLHAISCVRVTNYCLILVDMNLGDELGGFETIWLMKTLVDGAKIALLSDKVTPEYEKKALSLGVYHWIHKPINSRTTPKEIKNVFSENEVKRNPKSWNFLKEFIYNFTENKAGR